MLKENLNSLLSEAMKSKQDTRVNVLRDIKNTFMVYEKGDKNGPKVLTDDMEVKLLLKIKSQYQEELANFESAGASEFVTKLESELIVLEEYIPEQPTEEEIVDFTMEVISIFSHDTGRKVEMRDMKTILSMVQERYPMVTGQIVSKVVKSLN